MICRVQWEYTLIIPHYVIVSPEGRIIHVWSGYGTGVLKKKLEKWVK